MTVTHMRHPKVCSLWHHSNVRANRNKTQVVMAPIAQQPIYPQYAPGQPMQQQYAQPHPMMQQQPQPMFQPQLSTSPQPQAQNPPPQEAGKQGSVWKVQAHFHPCFPSSKL